MYLLVLNIWSAVFRSYFEDLSQFVTFLSTNKNSLSPCFYNLSSLQSIIPLRRYPETPETIDEHIRKRRLDLGLLQIEVAKIIGVTESTIWNWEHGTAPEFRHMPKIIEFLGYVPFESPEDPIGKLMHFKQVKGLSYERLGELMGRDPEQVSDWLSGRIKPCRRNIQGIIDFLKKQVRF